MLQAVKLPARVTRLDTGLADVDGDDFAHFGRAGGGGGGEDGGVEDHANCD